MMKRCLVVMLGFVLAVPALPDLGTAQTACPPEVEQAKEMLNQKQKAEVKPEDVAAPRSMAGARQDIQSPRGNQDVQSPRGNQNVQSPRGNQDVQSPRGNQDIQSPRGNQDVQSPRGNQDVQSPRAGTTTTAGSQAPRSSNLKKAASLVKEAEAACKAGNMSQASKKAKSALALMK